MAPTTHPPLLRTLTLTLPIRPQLQCTASSTPTPYQTRSTSTTRRSRKILNIAPIPAYGGPSGPTGATGRSKTARIPIPPTDHIVYNPPSTAPNVYHTPAKFLPKDDVRHGLLQQAERKRQEAIAALATQGQIPPKEKEAPLPPPVRKPWKQVFAPITREQIEEIRRLRREDEDTWTVDKLAQRFQCATTLVMRIEQTSQERRERLRKEQEENMKTWRRRGVVSPKTRAERKRRKDLWGVEC